jgi:DNA (cytosine-5)-methyltransferase 1
MTDDRPLLYDVFSGAGGASVGYSRAGFDVVGIDHKPQKNYPFKFIQMDAFAFFAAVERGDFPQPGAWHCSPPCQAYSSLQAIWQNDHPDLVAATRAALKATGRAYVIENVVGSPLLTPTLLCGTMFRLGLAGRRGYLRRHRLFESGPSPFLPLLTTPCNHPNGVRSVGVYGHTGGSTKRGSGNHFWYVPDWKEAMGIDWMTRDELAQAIPPAYTSWVGSQLMLAIRARAAA